MPAVLACGLVYTYVASFCSVIVPSMTPLGYVHVTAGPSSAQRLADACMHLSIRLFFIVPAVLAYGFVYGASFCSVIVPSLTPPGLVHVTAGPSSVQRLADVCMHSSFRYGLLASFVSNCMPPGVRFPGWVFSKRLFRLSVRRLHQLLELSSCGSLEWL